MESLNFFSIVLETFPDLRIPGILMTDNMPFTYVCKVTPFTKYELL